MATHSSVLTWEIPWTGEPGGLQSRGGRKELDTTERLTLTLGLKDKCLFTLYFCISFIGLTQIVIDYSHDNLSKY